jgi:Fe-S oxidoreductase
MATLKSEFLSHYYEKKMRPRNAYAFGWIYWWSRLASLMPGVVNFFTHAPLFSNLAKVAAGITQKRSVPKFAQQTFRNWFKSHHPTKSSYTQTKGNYQREAKQHELSKKKNKKVILWVDTFNNFFKPETLVAGMEVLEAAGFEVIISKRSICCGRPLYDFGMLVMAKKMLLQILDALRDEIRMGTPVVGLEPSCVAVFRDEMCDILPFDEDAKRLKQQTFTLAEFLDKEAKHHNIPQLNRKAIVHIHCHEKAIIKTKPEENLLEHMKLDYQMLDTGCCGMAGYFGYECGDHYDVSEKVGEMILLPAVRKAQKKTIVITDGFSCREQIEQLTDRKALHTAQVLQMALHENSSSAGEDYPEKKYVDGMKLKSVSLMIKRTAVLLSVAALVTACCLYSKQRNK